MGVFPQGGEESSQDSYFYLEREGHSVNYRPHVKKNFEIFDQKRTR